LFKPVYGMRRKNFRNFFGFFVPALSAKRRMSYWNLLVAAMQAPLTQPDADAIPDQELEPILTAVAEGIGAAVAVGTAQGILDPLREAVDAGIRQSNLLGLLWSEIDLQRRVMWIHPDEVKAKKAIDIPAQAHTLHHGNPAYLLRAQRIIRRHEISPSDPFPARRPGPSPESRRQRRAQPDQTFAARARCQA
jgi:integrase